MAAKKSKPRAVPRLHELKVDEIVEKGHQAVHASRKLVQESRIMTEASREIIKEVIASGRRSSSSPLHLPRAHGSGRDFNIKEFSSAPYFCALIFCTKP